MIYVYLRKTEDWETHTCSDLLSDSFFGQFTARVLAKKINAWNSVFSLNYFKYRSLLKSLSQKTFSNYKIEHSLQKIFDEITEEDFVLPSDDDDWLAPNIQEHLDPKIDIQYWDCVVLMSNGRTHMWSEYHDNLCSNNYCLSGSCVNKMLKEDVAKITLMLNDHAFVKKAINKSNLTHRDIQKPLSCYLWHIGSASYMISRKGPIKEQDKIEEIIVPKDANWLEEYLEEFATIHNQIKIKTKLFL